MPGLLDRPPVKPSIAFPKKPSIEYPKSVVNEVQTPRGIVPVKEARLRPDINIPRRAHAQARPESSVLILEDSQGELPVHGFGAEEGAPVGLESAASQPQEESQKKIVLDLDDEAVDVKAETAPMDEPKKRGGKRKKAAPTSGRWVLEGLPWEKLSQAKDANTLDSQALGKIIAESAPEIDYGAPKEVQAEQETKQREYIFEMMKYFGFPEDMAARILEKDEAGAYLLPTTYVPIRKLSKGGAMGHVFEARDLQVPGRELVMKAVYDKQHGLEEAMFDRFKQEALSLAAIRNEHVLGIKSADFMPDKSGAWYVMDKLQGGDLQDVVEQGPMDVAKAVDLMDQVADGLAATHRKGIVHRDLKPANIFIQQETDREGNTLPPTYKIADFGLAKQVEMERDKLEWVKQQIISIGEKTKSFADLEKFKLSKDFLAQAKAVYELVTSKGLMETLQHPDWAAKMASAEDSKEVLLKMKKLLPLLPAGGEYTYDVLLNKFEEDKWNWIMSEINRLAVSGDVDETDVRVPEQYVFRQADRAKLAEIANKKHEDRLFEDFEAVRDLSHRLDLKAGLTDPDSLVGTPLYMSPEQIGGVLTDTKSDVFSFGTIMYEALSGERPFDGDSVAAVIISVTEHSPEPLINKRPELPNRLSNLVYDMLEKDPDLRPSIEDVQAELRKIKDELKQQRQQQKVSTVRSLLNKLWGGK